MFRLVFIHTTLNRVWFSKFSYFMEFTLFPKFIGVIDMCVHNRYRVYTGVTKCENNNYYNYISSMLGQPVYLFVSPCVLRATRKFLFNSAKESFTVVSD